MLISEQFYLKKSKSYLLKGDDLFKGIDKLISESSEYIIIAFNVSIDNFKEKYNIQSLSRCKYKDIDMFCTNVSFALSQQSLFILKKTDLPNFIFKEIEKKEVEKYNLVEIDNEIKLYIGVVDLNKRADLHDEINIDRKEIDLKTQVLAVIDLTPEFRWKKDIEVVQFKLYSIYEEKGIPNTLSDIIPLEKEK
jgi:virulence-associated protein VapD